MTPQDKKKSYILVIAAGIVRLLSQLLYTLCGIESFWFTGNCISHILFWLALNILFQSNYMMRSVTVFFVALSTNDLLDQLIFNPGEFGWNEKVFFALSIIWLFRKIRKCRKLKNG